MSDVTPNPPGEGRHEALPPQGNGPWRVLTVVLAIIVALAIIGTLLWVFVFSKSSGGNPTNPPTSSAPPTEPPVTPPPLAACANGDITTTLGTPEVGAGQQEVSIIFENSGSVACTLEGYPSVQMIWQDNGALGNPATNDPGPVPVEVVTVEPGVAAQALLTIGTAADACAAPLDAIGFNIGLPNVPDPVFVSAPGYQGCADASVTIQKVSAIGAG